MNVSKISFIIPIYNTEIENFKQSITSIINQNIPNYEIILINDGTKIQELNDFYKGYSSENDNIKYFYQENSGSAVARNLGLNNVSGDLIFFVDADDQLTDNFFKNVNSIINIQEFDICCFDYSVWNIDSEEIHSLKEKKDLTEYRMDIMSNIMYTPDIFNDFLFGSIWGKCFSKNFLKDNNIRFIPNLRKAQDRMFMLECINNAKKILYYPVHIYKYRTNNNSICHKINYKMDEYYWNLYCEMKKFCQTNNIERKYYKFLEYNIINEILPLTLFHKDNNKKYCQIKKEFMQLYKKYDLKNALKIIKYRDIPTTKGKFKLLFFKRKKIYILYCIFKNKGKEISRMSFK